MHARNAILAPLVALSLALPSVAVAAPSPSEAEAAEAVAADAVEGPASEGSHPGGVYGEPVDYGWNDSTAGPEPETGPRVSIEIRNSLRPGYLTRVDGTEVCEAPCERRIGDPSGQFVLSGPGRKTSKPFSLLSDDALRLVVKGGERSRGVLGVVVIGVSAVLGIGLAITPTRVNMPRGAGATLWGTAAVVGVGGIASGIMLLRFSRTQVKVLAG